jgi:poly(A) polymerase Pap1
VAPADISAFTRLATGVKAWARARGLDSAPFGGLPGLAWVVMAARSVAAVEDASAALGHFFATWAAWDWHDPIALTEPIALTNLTAFANPTTSPQPSSLSVPSWSAVTVLTPSEPIRNCATQVGPGFRDLLAQELYEAWEIVESAADPWPRLLAPPPLHRRHAAWAVVDVSAADPEDFSALAGRARGRMRALMTALEEAGVAEAHAWPRPFLTSPAHAAFSIGLGRVPPSRATFDEIAARWVKGLPGVAVSLRDGGAVPTLR